MNTDQRPTPETDRLEYDQECNFNVAWEDECRRLERQRDEFREQLDNALNSIHSCGPDCKRAACVMRRQRDEAREIAGRLAATIRAQSVGITEHHRKLLADYETLSARINAKKQDSVASLPEAFSQNQDPKKDNP